MLRESYRTELEDVVNQLVVMSDSVQIAVRDATRALLHADLTTAERVISNDSLIDGMHETLEAECFRLLARQAPVAGELRTIVAAMQMSSTLGRMGDLAAHVAKIARLRYPEVAVPERMRENIERMSELAENMVDHVGDILAARDEETARSLADQDDEMDELRTEQFHVMLGDDWKEGVETAVDMALLGRYYERIADHAVSMGSKMIYIVTGEKPEGEQWPTT